MFQTKPDDTGINPPGWKAYTATNTGNSLLQGILNSGEAMPVPSPLPQNPTGEDAPQGYNMVAVTIKLRDAGTRNGQNFHFYRYLAEHKCWAHVPGTSRPGPKRRIDISYVGRNGGPLPDPQTHGIHGHDFVGYIYLKDGVDPLALMRGE